MVALLISGLLLLGIVRVPTTAGAVPVPWRNCGAAGDLISVQEADASVWPPQAGQTMTVVIKAVLGQSISGGFAVLIVNQQKPQFPYLRLRVFRVLPIPPLLAGPIQPHIPPTGPDGITFLVPAWLGGKTFQIDLDAYDTAGARLICVQATLPIKG